LHWQGLFESQVLDKNDQIYNHHFFIKKLGKWGSVQNRILMITNKVILKFMMINK